MATSPEPRDAGERDAPPVDVRFADSERFPSLVRTFWEVHGTFSHVRERVLPTTDLFVIVNLGAPHALIGNGREAVYCDAWVSGIQDFALLTGALGATDVWGARLSTRGGQIAFGATAALARQVVELRDLLGIGGIALPGRLRDASSFEERCRLFEEHLAAAIHLRDDLWRPEVGWALDRLAESEGVRIGDLAAEIGWSRKHLHAQFVTHFGHSPKTIARITRFERALRLMAADADDGLAGVASAAGYYDQAQFNREFRAFAGITPTNYLRNHVAGADYGFVDADG